MKICILILLGTVALGFTDNLMERAYGEALLKNLSPALRAKMAEIHSDETLKTLSKNEAVKIVKSRLTPEEIQELETAYRKLILPMLESTLERQFGEKMPLDDLPPMKFEEQDDDYQEESEESIDEDFLDSAERIARRNLLKNSERAIKEEL